MKRGKMTNKKGFGKVDQNGRSWPTGSTGNKKGRLRGKRGVSHAEWIEGVEGGKYTERTVQNG